MPAPKAAAAANTGFENFKAMLPVVIGKVVIETGARIRKGGDGLITLL